MHRSHANTTAKFNCNPLTNTQPHAGNFQQEKPRKRKRFWTLVNLRQLMAYSHSTNSITQCRHQSLLTTLRARSVTSI